MVLLVTMDNGQWILTFIGSSKDDEVCFACLFQQYQRDCAQALHDNKLCNADIADACKFPSISLTAFRVFRQLRLIPTSWIPNRAIIGVIEPFFQTQRTRAIFSRKVLSQLVLSSTLPDPDVDDAAVLKTVRVCGKC